jgi:hypothetical protein
MKAESLYAEATDPIFRPTDDQTIVSVENEYGRTIQFYDDGYGPIFLLHVPFGNFSSLDGIIRAMSLQDAYEIACDEFMQECDMSMEEIISEFGENFYENNSFCEQYEFRPNGPNKTDKYGHGICHHAYGDVYLVKATGHSNGLVIKYKTEE